MTENEIVQCFVVGVLAFLVGVEVGRKRAQATQDGGQPAASNGTGDDAMAWFQAWGGRP